MKHIARSTRNISCGSIYESANEFDTLIGLQIMPEHILRESNKVSKRWPQIQTVIRL
jgi:hypothetical protein